MRYPSFSPYLVLVVIFSSYFVTVPVTVAPTWVTSSYIQAASFKVINGDLCNCVTGNSTTPTATFTFAQAFPTIPNIGYGISSYQGNDTTADEKFQVNRTALTTTSYSIVVRIIGITNIWTMQIRYIAISKLFPHHVNSFDNVPVNYTYGPIVNISASSTSVRTFTNIINYSNQATASGSTYTAFSTPLSNNKIILFMTSLYIIGTLDISYSTPIPLNLTINADPISISSYKLEVIFGINASISKLHFSMVIFDQYEVQLSGQYSIVYSKIFMTTATNFYAFPSQFLNNFMVGFLSFTSDKTGKCINFVNTFGVVSGSHGLSKSLSTARNNFDPITGYVFNVFYLKTWTCPSSTFLDQTNNMCTDCSLTGCIVCLNLTACVQCNSNSNYFINSSTQTCSLCSIPGCITCSSLTACTSCNGGLNYILVNNTCILCDSTLKYFANTTSNACQQCTLSQCLTCSSLTACSVCNNSNLYYLNGNTCSFCDPALNYFINSTTVNCQPCQLTNCATCSSLTACSVCDNSVQSFLNPSDSLCYACSIPNCQSCNSLTSCSICDTASGYALNSSTGLCSLCGVGLFINSTSRLCQPCTLSQCLTCSSLTACSVCNNSNLYYLNGNTCSFCDPALNYFINSTTANCQPCQLTNCIICSSLTACSVCDNSVQSFLNPSDSLCYACSIPNCQSCNSLTSCSICDTASGYALNSSTGLCSLCGVGLFINSTSRLCQPCTLSQCLTCSSLTACSSCNTTNNYYLNGSTCSYCDPALNYFINSTTVNCQPCQLTNCATCSSLTACSVCDNSVQSFLNPSDSLCYACSIPNCQSCNSLTSCSICDTASGYALNSSTGLCSLCGVGLFINSTSRLCQPCTLSQCLTCSSLTACSSCNTTNNYYLNGSTCSYCDPALNYFINSTTVNCQPCQLTNCATCSSLTACSVCDNSVQSFLNPSDSLCYACSIPNCQSCNSLTSCSICDTASGYALNSSTGLCSLCNESNYILNSVSGICEVSNCIPIFAINFCGDNLLDVNEQCDDGNNILGDGCSNKCAIQPDFACQKNFTQCNSICLYQKELDLSIKYIEKKQFTNQIQVIIQLLPKQSSFWESLNFGQMISLSDMTGFDNFTVIKNPDKTVSIMLNYNTNIHNREITVVLDPKKSQIMALSKLSSKSKTFFVIPHNNQNALYYTNKQYEMAKVIQYTTNTLAGLSLLLYFIGLFAGKLIGLQMIAVLQIAVLALLTQSDLNPCFKALSGLQLVNGVNFFSMDKSYMLDQKTSSSMKGLKLFSIFIKNYNLNLSLFCIAFLLSLLFFLISKTLEKNYPTTASKLKNLSKRCICQITLNLLIFSGYIVGVAFGLQVLFGFGQTEDIFSVVSIAECIIVLLLFLIYFFLFTKFKIYFGQFYKQFEKVEDKKKGYENPKCSLFLSKWYNFMMVERIVIGCTLVFLIQVKLGLLLPISVFMVFLVISILFKPYANFRNNFRFAINMAISITILVIYLFYRHCPFQDKSSEKWYILAIAVCILLIVCIVSNAICLFYDIFLGCKRQEKPLQLANTTNTLESLREQKMENFTDEKKQKYYEIAKQIKRDIKIEKVGEQYDQAFEMKHFELYSDVEFL